MVNISNLLLMTETNILILSLVLLLLVGNIVFVVLFILSIARNNKLEEQMREDLIQKLNPNSISKTEADLVKQHTTTTNEYKVLEDKKRNGWIIKRTDRPEIIAFAATKEEANEIVKNLSN